MLVIVGIILIIACVLSLLYAALNLFVYYHALDGSAELYSRLHQRVKHCPQFFPQAVLYVFIKGIENILRRP